MQRTCSQHDGATLPHDGANARATGCGHLHYHPARRTKGQEPGHCPVRPPKHGSHTRRRCDAEHGSSSSPRERHGAVRRERTASDGPEAFAFWRRPDRDTARPASRQAHVTTRAWRCRAQAVQAGCGVKEGYGHCGPAAPAQNKLPLKRESRTAQRACAVGWKPRVAPQSDSMMLNVCTD